MEDPSLVSSLTSVSVLGGVDSEDEKGKQKEMKKRVHGETEGSKEETRT